MSDGLGAVEGSIEIGLDHLHPLLDAGVKDAGVGGTASIGDEGVHLAKLLDDVLNDLLDGGIGVNVALVCFALDIVFLRKFLGILLTSLRAGGICDSQAGCGATLATVRYLCNLCT